MARCNTIKMLILHDATGNKHELNALVLRMNLTNLPVSRGEEALTSSTKIDIGDIFELIKDCSNLRNFLLGQGIFQYDPKSVPDETELPLRLLVGVFGRPSLLESARAIKLPNLRGFYATPISDPRTLEPLPVYLQTWRPTLT